MVVIRADRPMRDTSWVTAVSTTFSGGHVPTQVDDLIAVVFQDDLDNIFADVVNIPLDGGQDDLPLGDLLAHPEPKYAP